MLRRRRAFALAAVAVALVVVALALLQGHSYTVSALFQNAGQIVTGDHVMIAGAPVGSVDKVAITDDGQAKITFSLDQPYTPLRQGTRAIIRQASLSGIANRYIELRLPPYRQGAPAIPDGGVLDTSHTTTIVELDQLFDTFDAKTRESLKEFIRGFGTEFQGVASQANAGFQYLNPSISTSSAVFRELNSDTPMLAGFLDDTARFADAVASRGDQLTSLIHNLDLTTRALGDQAIPLSEAIQRLPAFMRQSNTTFVDLRSALDDVDPLVNASKPAALKLQVLLPELIAFAQDARPTLTGLDTVLNRPGQDLPALLRTLGPLASAALDTQHVNGADRPGSFAENEQALNASAPIIAFGRPYTPDMFGWFRDFGITGNYDAIGSFARAHSYINAFAYVNGTPQLLPITSRASNFQAIAKTGQYRRCPGAADAPAADGSNVWSPAEQQALDCTESARAVAP